MKEERSKQGHINNKAKQSNATHQSYNNPVTFLKKNEPHVHVHGSSVVERSV